MCIVFLILSDTKSSDTYHSILCHGRDEVLSRPTLRAHQWTSPGGVFAGRDRVANGTVRSISIHFFITKKKGVVSQNAFERFVLMWMRVHWWKCLSLVLFLSLTLSNRNVVDVFERKSQILSRHTHTQYSGVQCRQVERIDTEDLQRWRI